jgi:ABC-type glycerol-3-phosphate transport system permease component
MAGVRFGDRLFATGSGLFIALCVAFFVFPYFWTLETAIKSPDEVYAIPSVWIPSSVYLGNFRFVFDKQFGVNLLNSTIVATTTTLFVLVLGSIGAYALARIQFWGRGVVLLAVLSVSMFPEVSVVAALFMWLRDWAMLNTFQALILPYASFAMPFTLWALTNFFREVPWELEEAALIDGCTYLGALWRVILPLAAPGLVTCGILVFISAWNEFLFAYTFVTTDAVRTVPVRIFMFQGEFESPWGQISAASAVVTLPLIIMVLIFQRRIIQGLTAGAIKG